MTQIAIRMLSIDDKMLTTDLDRAGYRKIGVMVRSAKTFQEAQDILKGEEIDIIVINFDYEKVDGLSVCRHLKATPETKEIPVVFTSVQSAASTRNDCLKAGADLFVEQPLPRQYFIEKLRTLLEQKVRETERVNHDGQVNVIMGDDTWTCVIGDLSKSGILLSTQNNIKPGTVLDLEFVIPGYKKPVRVTGEVVRRITDRADGNVQVGIGVRFDVFHGDSQKRLEKYVTKSHNDDPKMVYYL